MDISKAISWLTFENSATDDVMLREWTSSGTPALSTNYAIRGKSLELDGSSTLTSENVEICGGPFSVNFWVRIDSSCPDGGIVFRIRRASNDVNMISCRLDTSYSTPRLLIWYNSDKNVSASTGSKLSLSASNITQQGDFYHVVINHSSDGKLYLKLENQNYQYNNSATKSFYKRQDYYIEIGGNGFVGNIDEFVVLDKATFGNSVSELTSSFYSSVTFLIDVKRRVKNALLTWRYENPGQADLLVGVTGTTVTGLEPTASLTGKGYYQPDRTACFGIAATKELWIRCDIYTTSAYTTNNRIRIYSGDSNGANGWASNATITNPGALWHNGTSQAGPSGGYFAKNKMRSFWMHMRSGTTDGIIEYAYGTTSDSYVGNVNAGDDFANFYIQMDGANIYVSNLIISNDEVGVEEGAVLNFYDTQRNIIEPFIETLDVDLSRQIYKTVTLDVDLSRQVVGGQFAVQLDIDTTRTVLKGVTDSFDTVRTLSKSVALAFDSERKIQNEVTISYDVEILDVVTVNLDVDLNRAVLLSQSLVVDLERDLVYIASFTCDLWRKIPHKIYHNSSIMQRVQRSNPAPSGNIIKSINIMLNEQQLTDNITFTHIGDIGIMDAVYFGIYDYATAGRAEETLTKGVLQTCKCTCDVDEILYKQMAYTVPEAKWEWTPEYLEAIGRYNETHEEQVDKIPSAPASAHIQSIADALGKGLSLHFTDFISTMSTDVQSGTNYAGLISELFGWTSRIPQMMINCYMRGNMLYVIQRGQEQHTVTIDNLKLTVHSINKKIVRTTWGSDVWSKTEVKPYYNDWSEFNQDSFNPMDDQDEEGGGSISYGDDNLTEQTVVEHGDETVVTNYEYKTLADGRKFLYKETATTYSGGSQVDEVVTIHDPVSNTQAHIYAADDDGVLGSVLTSSNHDDRVTPYQQMESISGIGYYSGNKYGTVVSDSQGNQYLLYGITHHQDKIDMMKRTIQGVSLIDTSFPVDGQSKMEELTQAIIWLDRKTEESVTLDIYDYTHIIDFNDKISWNGHTYYLRSNNVMISESVVNKQTIEFVRWY